MADKLGLDRSYLADVERGKRNVSLLNLDVIAKGFSLSLSRLFSRLWVLNLRERLDRRVATHAVIGGKH